MKRALFLLGLGLFCSVSIAAGKQGMAIEDPWVSPSNDKGEANVFFLMTPQGPKMDRLQSVSTPIGKTQITSWSPESGFSQRMKIRSIDIHGPIKLRPHAFHIFVTGIRKPVKEGDTVPVTLRFKEAGTIKVSVPVRGTEPLGDISPAAEQRAK